MTARSVNDKRKFYNSFIKFDAIQSYTESEGDHPRANQRRSWKKCRKCFCAVSKNEHVKLFVLMDQQDIQH